MVVTCDQFLLVVYINMLNVPFKPYQRFYVRDGFVITKVLPKGFINNFLEIKDP